jgi:hypothetical protein
MDIIKLANIFEKAATISDKNLGSSVASNILSAFSIISKKQYDSLADIEYDVVSALSPITIDDPQFMEGRNGFKSKLGYSHGETIDLIKNAQLGVAWKKIGNIYRAAAHILDITGSKRINDPRDLLTHKPSPKPKYWPGEGERFTRDPDIE